MSRRTTTDCYVYLHRAKDGEIVYVGFGRAERCLSARRRSQEHERWMTLTFASIGLRMAEIVASNLSEGEARALESSLIVALRPRFNKQQNGAANAGRGHQNHNSRFSPAQVASIRSRYEKSGLSMRQFHKEQLPHVCFSTARKLLGGLSYR